MVNVYYKSSIITVSVLLYSIGWKDVFLSWKPVPAAAFLIVIEPFPVLFVVLQDMVTQHHCPMAERPSALSTLRLASPSPSSSSPLRCKGSWCSAHGGQSRTSTGNGACQSHWWQSFMLVCSPCWPSLASSSSLPPSSQRWRRTGTSWSPSTSASFPSPQSALETTYLEKPQIRTLGSSTKWASLVSTDDSSYLKFSSWQGGGSCKVSN